MTKKKTKNLSATIGKKRKPNRQVRQSKSKEELAKRRMREYELVLMGETQRHIAEMMGLDIRTIEKDLSVVREAGGKKYSLQQMLGKMNDYDEKSMRRMRELWKIVIGAKSTNDEVIRALKELRKEDTEAIKREQIAGILPKEVSPLISVDASSESGDAENKVLINIIAPTTHKKKVDK